MLKNNTNFIFYSILLFFRAAGLNTGPDFGSSVHPELRTQSDNVSLPNIIQHLKYLNLLLGKSNLNMVYIALYFGFEIGMMPFYGLIMPLCEHNIH